MSQPSVGVSVMPLDNRADVLLDVATVAERLGVLQVPEGEARLRDLHVLARRLVELDEKAVRWAALVVLARRVEIARAVSERRRAPGPLA